MQLTQKKQKNGTYWEAVKTVIFAERLAKGINVHLHPIGIENQSFLEELKVLNSWPVVKHAWASTNYQKVKLFKQMNSQDLKDEVLRLLQNNSSSEKEKKKQIEDYRFYELNKQNLNDFLEFIENKQRKFKSLKVKTTMDIKEMIDKQGQIESKNKEAYNKKLDTRKAIQQRLYEQLLLQYEANHPTYQKMTESILSQDLKYLQGRLSEQMKA